MKISIAMTTFNGSKYLQEQLDSFLAQTRQPDELVICDDCSTDNTLDLLHEFQAHAPFPVHIYSNETNQGYIANFEKALSLCNGDLIFLSDQDDVWLKGKISTVGAVFNNNPETMVIINDSFVTDERCDKRFFSKLAAVKANGLSQDAYIAGCATAIRMEFLNMVLPFPQPAICSHDLWINKLAILSGVRTVLPQKLQLYRRHTSNVTKNSIGANKKILFPALAALSNFGIRDCRNEWRDEIYANKAFIDRLVQFQSIGSLLNYSSGKIDNAINNLNKKNLAIEQRIQLLGLRKHQRFPRVTILLISGFYDQFQGWKSAIKDILR